MTDIQGGLSEPQSFVKQIIAGQVRHLLTVAAGALVANGALQGSQKDQFVNIGAGLVMWAVVAAWSWWQKVGQKRAAALIARKPATVAAAKPAVKAVIILCFVAAGALAFSPIEPLRAQTQPVHRTARHKIVARVPLPAPDPRLYDTTATKAQLTAQQVQSNPLILLQQFTVSDIQNAIKLANAQTPPDTTSLQCWNALLPIVQSLPAGTSSSSTSTTGNPTQIGVATGIQDARDVQQLIANLQSNSGPLATLNTACAPLVVNIQTTLTLLGVAGGVVASGGAPAAATATAALQALLTALKLPIP